MTKNSLKLTAFAAGLLASSSAFAGATINVGAFSEYMFRGIPQTGGAAVQGGVDYSHESGWYVGTWASNIGFAGGTEQDVYTGFTKTWGKFGFDVGAIYYWYPEEDETGGDFSTVELYAGAILGPVTVKYYYSDEANFMIGDGLAEQAGYLVANLAWPITDSLNFTAGLGMYDGDEIERFLVTEDSYVDYNIGIAKTMDNGITGTLQYVDTDIEAGAFEDDPKVVVGLKKVFEL